MRFSPETVTPVTKIKNEDWWIHYVLRDLFRYFPRFIMLDTGSTDATKHIARETARKLNRELILIEEDFGDDANRIGNSPNILRQMCPTYWMMLVDGDEIWRADQLELLFELDVPDDKEVFMVTGRNLADVDGCIKERDGFSADRLFSPVVRWHKRTDYPFESHGLEDRCAAGKVGYLPVYFWHTRHLTRSGLDGDAYFRDLKRGYFPYDGPYKDMPADWLGEIGPYPNGYLGVE